MRKITSYVALASVPTMVAGIYGMNFDTQLGNMPELGWKYGYYFFWVMVVVIVGSIFFWLKRKRWI